MLVGYVAIDGFSRISQERESIETRKGVETIHDEKKKESKAKLPSKENEPHWLGHLPRSPS
jgi:hypothetical protein